MVETIVWTPKAKQELSSILSYWNHRNHSFTYSKKLLDKINKIIDLLFEFPELGNQAKFPNTRVIVIHKFLLFYQIKDNQLIVTSVRDGRRDE